MIKAVIFDLDGVLVDTFEGHAMTFNQALKAKGYEEAKREEFGRYYGQTGEEIMRKLMGKPRVDNEVKETLELKRTFYRAAKGAYIKPLPGAKELVSALYGRKVSMAVASSAAHSSIDAALKKIGVTRKITVIISSEDITHSKPHPETFLKAAEALKIHPEDCLVFEDSLHGVVAARAAGMKCVAVATGTAPKEELEKLHPDLIIDTLEQMLPPKLDGFLRKI